MPRRKIKPCRECESTNIELWDKKLGFFNPGGGRCLSCGFEVEAHSDYKPTENTLILIWNKGQKHTPLSKSILKLKIEKEKNRKLRNQIRKIGLKPII